MATNELVVEAALALLDESFQGATGGSWYSDADNPQGSILGLMESISSGTASKAPGPGRNTIASHIDHARYYVGLANKELRGERAFAEADWKTSFALQSVDDEGWARLKDAVRDEYLAFRHAVEGGGGWLEHKDVLVGVFALIAHTAYHLGAVRQIVRDVA